MPYDEEPKQKPEKGLEEQKEEQFSFLQETIKPKPVTRRKILTQLARVGIYELILQRLPALVFLRSNRGHRTSSKEIRRL